MVAGVGYPSPNGPKASVPLFTLQLVGLAPPLFYSGRLFVRVPNSGRLLGKSLPERETAGMAFLVFCFHPFHDVTAQRIKKSAGVFWYTLVVVVLLSF